ncbi:hypothetical protein FH972_002595 [Carpinus fangiana]|uniref:Uncharacterized protein n=1 Tax=Carpinus fangiana TaxID=176857 RepID=A0A5N6QFD0_9ROSI|nr:hypothetical protein FH972_002595 [Carpinus fangiana]
MWLSRSGLYAFGFYKQGNGYAVGIFMAGIPKKTVVCDREPASTETQARDYSNQTPTPAHSIHSKDHRTRQLNAHHAKINSCNPFLSRLCTQTRSQESSSTFLS